MVLTMLVLLGVVLVVRFARRRRTLFAIVRTDPMSTFHGDMSRKQSAKTRKALDAATAVLR